MRVQTKIYGDMQPASALEFEVCADKIQSANPSTAPIHANQDEQNIPQTTYPPYAFADSTTSLKK